MAVGIFNPNPPFPILDEGGVGNWWQLRYMSWEVREPGYAVGRYAWDGARTHIVEIFGEGFAFANSRLYGPSVGPLVSGTVTGYRESWEGVPLWTFTGFSLTASEILQYGSSPDPYYGLEDYVLRGADTITGTNGDNSISGREGDDELHGRAGADRLWGNQGADRLFGAPGNDSLDGATGDDTLRGDAGDDSLAGGLGRDTAETSALRRQASVTFAEGGGVTVEGPEGRDALSGVEVLRFADGSLHLDPAGTAGQVWRLYDAALGRAPEATALGAWTQALDARATTLSDVAEDFIASAEFARRHGSLDDAGFVARLYADVLGRTPGTAELDGWTARLAGGASRAEVLLGFSESAEHRAATDASTGRLWAVDPEAVEVVRCYLTVLDRLPDASGLAEWTAQRNDARLTGAQMTDALLASAEFQSRFGALSNGEFVERLYLHALDRPADAAGRAAWTSGLDGGAIGRRDAVQGFAQSEEMTQKLLPLVTDGVAFA